MTGLVKAVVSPGPLEQSPAGSQDRKGREHWAEGGSSSPASQQEAGERREETEHRPLILKVRAISTKTGNFAFWSLNTLSY